MIEFLTELQLSEEETLGEEATSSPLAERDRRLVALSKVLKKMMDQMALRNREALKELEGVIGARG